MSSKAVQDRFQAFMDANWSSTPIYDVDNDIPDETPRTSLDPWIAIQYPGALEEQMSTGAPGTNVWREEGTIAVHIQVASGTGTDVMSGLGEELSNLLRGIRIDGIQIQSITPPNYREDVKAFQGNWYSMTTILDYYYDLHA